MISGDEPVGDDYTPTSSPTLATDDGDIIGGDDDPRIDADDGMWIPAPGPSPRPTPAPSPDDDYWRWWSQLGDAGDDRGNALARGVGAHVEELYIVGTEEGVVNTTSCETIFRPLQGFCEMGAVWYFYFYF